MERPRDEEAPADRFVRLACVSYTDSDAETGRLDEAARLANDPGVRRSSLAAAVVSGELDAVRSMIANDAAAASGSGGPYGWSPLMYLGFSRLDIGEHRALRLATLLLDAGADPNDGRCFGGLPTPFTVLTGVLGGGELGQPAHPHRGALARLLLERGAEPNDVQALYNLQFESDDSALGLLFEFGLGRGDGGPWRRRSPDGLPAPARLVRRLLWWAIVHDQRARVAMLTAHGVDVIRPTTSFTPLALALCNGHVELAERLRELGAAEVELDRIDSVMAAALAGDRAAVATLSADDVSAARTARPGLIVWAAALGRPDAVEVLIELGFDIDEMARGDVPRDEPWQTALHTAVEHDDLALVRRLLELGADRTIRDARFDGTPADWAEHLERREIAAVLAS